jgi:enoyl-CoA hydratase/carnithine racemase
MVALSRNVSRKRAMEMLLLGEALPASDAMAYGLVNRVVPVQNVMSEALGMARAIASKSKEIVAIGKEAFYAQAELPLDEAYDYASEVMVKNMMLDDAKEGICAFIEKRPAQWRKS